MTTKVNHIAKHEYSFKYGVYPQDKVDELMDACGGFSFTYGEQIKLNPNLVSKLILQETEKVSSQGYPVAFDLFLPNPFGVKLLDNPVVALHQNWTNKEVKYDWCHISDSFQEDQYNTVICITPRKKHSAIQVIGISERYLELAAKELGMDYERYEYVHPFSKAEERFNHLFPTLDSNSTLLGYKRRFIDFQQGKWSRKRKINQPSPTSLDAPRFRAMKYIEQAFSAYEVEKTAMQILGISQRQRLLELRGSYTIRQECLKRQYSKEK